MKKLKKEERLLLLKFVCAFAWADLEVKDSERALVKKLVKSLELDADEKKQVDAWLKKPPRPEEIDPNKIPRAHRQLFLDTAKQMIAVDGVVDEAEAENFELLEQLLV